MSNHFLEQQLEQADKLIEKLNADRRPYMQDYRIVSRINRKLTKARAAKRELLKRIQEYNEGVGK